MGLSRINGVDVDRAVVWTPPDDGFVSWRSGRKADADCHDTVIRQDNRNITHVRGCLMNDSAVGLHHRNHAVGRDADVDGGRGRRVTHELTLPFTGR